MDRSSNLAMPLFLGRWLVLKPHRHSVDLCPFGAINRLKSLSTLFYVIYMFFYISVIDLKKLIIPDPKYHMTLPYFMRLGVNPPIGIHYAHNPGYPASHGCVRIGSMKSAITLYNLTPTGTEVTIL
jgi:hypothetical protein